MTDFRSWRYRMRDVLGIKPVPAKPHCRVVETKPKDEKVIEFPQEAGKEA